MNGDDRLRDILPLLRPRSAEPTLFSQTVWYLLWAGVAVLIALYVRRWLRLRRQRREEFFAAGLDAGLTEKQTELLYGIARTRRMQTPVRLLTTAHVFDRHVGAVAAELARKDRGHPRVATLGRIRTALGFDEVPSDQALVSTRQIERGQTVMVEIHEEGKDEAFLPWLILERDEGTLTVAPVLREEGAAEVAQRLRPGHELRARFWREGDTEYSFTTRVLGKAAADSDDAGAGFALEVEHARVQRRQQRDFYRIEVDFPIDFRVVDTPDDDLAAATEAAAVDLLSAPATGATPADQSDAPGGEDAADDDSAVPSQEPDADAVDDSDMASGLGEDEALALHGRVVNLSAGGLAVELDEPLAATDAGGLWLVDPAFEGPFPMAALPCQPVGTEPAAAGIRVKLRFESLPPPVEKAIVRAVYEHQLQTAAGRDPDAPGPDAAAAAEVDDGLPQP